MAHPKEAVMRSGYEAFQRGDLDALRAIFDEDIAWHIGGRSQISGDYRGIDDVFGFFGRIFELSGGTFAVDVLDIVANDDHAFVLVKLRAQRTSRTLDSTEAHVWNMAGGKATGFWGLPKDFYSSEDFWS
jgi:ketosteroid isomerase-like protein